MKLLIMCEGPNELKIINILLENQIIHFAVMCKHGYCHSQSVLSALTKCSGYDTDQ